ncbi:MAG: VWA domain-containing protein [bacterium]|nr:VWA domain-containing protein [bacterium]
MLKADANVLRYIYPLNTEKFSSKPIKDVSIEVNIETEEPIKMLFCSTHNVEIKRKSDTKAVVRFEDKDVIPDIDFVVYYSTNKEEIDASVLTYREAGEDGFFILNITPSFSLKEEEIQKKDIVFVIDTSGSMAGKKIEQAKRALDFCITNLNKQDRFEVIRFSTEAESLFKELKTAYKNNIESARRFVARIQPAGDTNIEEALSLAFSVFDRKEQKYGSIIFITDGKPTIGITDENELIRTIEKRNKNNIRIFVFGIDYELNTHLLDRVAEVSYGYRDYVTPEEDIELKITSFYEKIKYPVLSDIHIDFKGLSAYNIYPKKVPDLFKGSQITITGRYKKSGRLKVNLEGYIEGKKKRFEYVLNFPLHSPSDVASTTDGFIPQIWAAQHIGYLLDEIRLKGENEELKDEIIAVANKYGIITPYTSYLIIEEEQHRQSTGKNNISISPSLREVLTTPVMEAKMKAEIKGMQDKSGKKSVVASKELYALRNAQNYQQVYQGRERMEYKDSSGKVQNLTGQVKNIQGRAVYQDGNRWTDSAVYSMKNFKKVRIQFGSKDYFELVKNKPASTQFLALGKNVQFVINDTIYDIYE